MLKTVKLVKNQALFLPHKNPTFILQDAIQGMLPKSKLGRKMATKLKIYAGNEHPHQAHNPQLLQ